MAALEALVKFDGLFMLDLGFLDLRAATLRYTDNRVYMWALTAPANTT